MCQWISAGQNSFSQMDVMHAVQQGFDASFQKGSPWHLILPEKPRDGTSMTRVVHRLCQLTYSKSCQPEQPVAPADLRRCHNLIGLARLAVRHLRATNSQTQPWLNLQWPLQRNHAFAFSSTAWLRFPNHTAVPTFKACPAYKSTRHMAVIKCSGKSSPTVELGLKSLVPAMIQRPLFCFLSHTSSKRAGAPKMPQEKEVISSLGSACINMPAAMQRQASPSAYSWRLAFHAVCAAHARPASATLMR